jgi:predicted regulator of Ras-like GTPase activity (Roadblock/LC7/MglB family)
MNVAPQLHRAAGSAAETLRGLSGVVAVVVASADGFDIASSVSRGIDAARVAAMASSISAIATVAAQEGRLSRCRQVTVGTADGFVHVSTVSRPDGEFVINVIADGGAVLAQVAYSAAEQVRALEAA